MTAEAPDSMHRQVPSVLARGLRIAVGVAVLLLLSEAVWLWQTLPVRQLVQPPAPSAPAAPTR